MVGPDLRHDPYASLRIANFRWFIVSLLTMNVATQLQAVVVSWQVYALTRDPLSLGLIGLAESGVAAKLLGTVPSVVLGGLITLGL